MTEAKTHPDELPPIAIESRRRARRKTLLGGLVVSRDGARTLPCTVRELSDTGARLKIVNRDGVVERIIPTHAFLLITGRDVAQEIEVVWVKHNEYGVRIVATLPLDGSAPQYGFLRRLKKDRPAPFSPS